MDRILIEGGTPLHGTLAISDPKNGFAAHGRGLLTDQPVSCAARWRLPTPAHAGQWLRASWGRKLKTLAAARRRFARARP